MDRNELIKEWNTYEEDHFTNPEDGRFLSELVADFALEMYKAGQRAERVRIAGILAKLLYRNSYRAKWQSDAEVNAFIDELRADLAESGE